MGFNSGFKGLKLLPQQIFWATCYLFVALQPIHHQDLLILDHTQRRTTLGRTPLNEWSASRRDLYVTTHNTTDKHPCPRRDSNPQGQQASSRRPTP